MARRTNRRKKSPNAAIPTYREDSKTTSGPDPKLAIIALLLVVLLIGSGLYLTSIVEEAPVVFTDRQMQPHEGNMEIDEDLFQFS